MNILVKSHQSQVEEIADLIIKGIECWYKAGEILCGLIDNDPDVIDKICKEVPMLTPNVLRQIERIGRKQLVPELLLKSGPGWNRLRTMPYNVQKRFLSAPVEVLINTDSGPDTLKVSIDNLTLSQARQVFSDDGDVRDLASQRAWVAAHAPVIQEPKEARKPYSVHGRNLVITQPCKLSLQEIGVILAEMRS